MSENKKGRGEMENKRERVERNVYDLLLRMFEKIKGKSLNMSESACLRRVISQAVDYWGIEKEGDIVYMAQDAFFYEVLGIDRQVFDPKKKGGFDLSDEELRGLWQKYERDGDVPYPSWTNLDLAKKEYEGEEKLRKKKD